MAKDKLTAEEQLLNLIEDGQGPQSLRMKRKQSSRFGSFSLSGVVSFFPFLFRTIKEQLIRLKNAIREPNLKVWNKVLAGLAALAFIYLTADFIFRRLDISQIVKKMSTVKGRSFKEVPLPEARPFLYYLEMVQRRDIFLPVRLKTIENPDEQARKALATQLKDLKLVGISWGEDPQVIIENTKENKTYFIKTGDSVGEFKINTILKDRVILEADGQKMDLI